MSTRAPRRRDVVIVALLVAGLLGSLVLVIFGGSDPAALPDDAGGRPSLPVEDLSLAGIAEWSGLAIPADAADFLTARPSDTQLDVTFTIPAEDEDDFVEASGLDAPVAGARLVLHSSPLWKLNPGSDDETGSTDVPATDPTVSSTVAEGPEIRGVADVHDGITRVVELYDESPGVVRARIVLTPAA